MGIMSKMLVAFIAIALVSESSGATLELPDIETILLERDLSPAHEELLENVSERDDSEDALKKLDHQAIRRSLFMSIKGEEGKPTAEKIDKTQKLTANLLEKKKAGKKTKKAVHKVAGAVTSLRKSLKAKLTENKKLKELLAKKGAKAKQAITKVQDKKKAKVAQKEKAAKAGKIAAEKAKKADKVAKGSVKEAATKKATDKTQERRDKSKKEAANKTEAAAKEKATKAKDAAEKT